MEPSYEPELSKNHKTTTGQNGPRKVLFECCNIYFKKQDDLQDHLKSHTRKINCGYCSYQCDSLSMLKRHKHSKAKFKCLDNSYKYKHNYILNSSILKRDLRSQLYKCNDCNYECDLKDQFKSHMLKHSDFELFKCCECSYECFNKGNLKLHMLKHLKYKLFRCCECRYECYNKVDLQRHTLKHEKKKKREMERKAMMEERECEHDYSKRPKRKTRKRRKKWGRLGKSAYLIKKEEAAKLAAVHLDKSKDKTLPPTVENDIEKNVKVAQEINTTKKQLCKRTKTVIPEDVHSEEVNSQSGEDEKDHSKLHTLNENERVHQGNDEEQSMKLMKKENGTKEKSSKKTIIKETFVGYTQSMDVEKSQNGRNEDHSELQTTSEVKLEAEIKQDISPSLEIQKLADYETAQIKSDYELNLCWFEEEGRERNKEVSKEFPLSNDTEEIIIDDKKHQNKISNLKEQQLLAKDNGKQVKKKKKYWLTFSE